MPTFQYEGIEKNTGKIVKGVKDAPSKHALTQTLLKSGIFVSDVKELKRSGKKKFEISFDFNVKKYIPDVYFQIGLMIKSGIPLVQSIKIVSENIKNSRLKQILTDIASQIEEGNRFSDALLSHKKFFNEVHISLIKAAENAGRLADTLIDIFEYEEEKRQSMDKVKSALIYPVTVLILGFGVLGFLLTFVVPKMQKIFASLKKELPLSTRILIKSGEFFKQHGFEVMIFILGVVILIRLLYWKNMKFRKLIDGYLLNINYVKDILISKLSHTLSFQLKEGLPLVEALRITTKTLNNKILQDYLIEIAEEISQGEKFSESLKKKKIFPELFVSAIATGEKSGNLVDFLERISEFYSRQFNKFSQRIISVIEPLFIVFIGSIVGFIVMSIMGPLFEINTFVK